MSRLSHFPSRRAAAAVLAAAVVLAAGRASAADNPGPPPDETTGITMPRQFKSAEGPVALASASTTSSDAPWWTLFRDPALDQLEAQALGASPDLHGAMERVLEARAQAAAAASGLLPQVSAPLAASRVHTTNTGPVTTSRLIGAAFFPTTPGTPDTFQGQALENTYSDYQLPLAVAYEVDVFGRIRNARDQARAIAEATAAERQSLRLSLTSQVAATYFALRAADSAVAVLQNTSKLRGESVDVQEHRVKGGAASDVDLLRARVEASNTEADLVDAVQERAELENALAVLCGQPASDVHVAAQPLEQVAFPAVPMIIPAQLLSQRPDLVEAEHRIVAAAAGEKVARAEFYPVFNVQGAVGFESAQDNLLLEGQSHTWAIGGTINIPIFTGGRNSADLRAARARREEAYDAYRQAALGALREVEDALSSLRSRVAQADARQRAIADARRVSSALQHSYGEGGLTYFEVIDSQRVLLAAELAGVRTQSARYAAAVDLIRAMGGTFVAASAAP